MTGTSQIYEELTFIILLYTHPEFGGVHQVSPQVHVVPVGGTLVPKNVRTFNRYDGELVIALSESRSTINVQCYSQNTMYCVVIMFLPRPTQEGASTSE